MVHENIRPHACTAEGCHACFVHPNHLKQHVASNHSERGILRRKLREERAAKFLTAVGVALDRELLVHFCGIGTRQLARVDFVAHKLTAPSRSSATNIRTKPTLCSAM
jgi:hypothetical protein